MNHRLKYRQRQAAASCAALLDSTFFKAFSEPARNGVFQEVILHGRADIGTIAKRLPQDRSVVSRHLRILTEAGILHACREGRRTLYEVNTDVIEQRLQEMLDVTRLLKDATKQTCHLGEDE